LGNLIYHSRRFALVVLPKNQLNRRDPNGLQEYR
jgi:hypothetical protein